MFRASSCVGVLCCALLIQSGACSASDAAKSASKAGSGASGGVASGGNGGASSAGVSAGSGGANNSGNTGNSAGSSGATLEPDAGLEPFDTSVLEVLGEGVTTLCRLSDDQRKLLVRIRNKGTATAPPIVVRVATSGTEHALSLTTPELLPAANAELAFDRGPLAGFGEQWKFEVGIDPDGLRGAPADKTNGQCSALRVRLPPAMKVLRGRYDVPTGLWDKHAWWTGANMLEVSIDYARETSDPTYLDLIETSFVQNADGAKHPDGWDMSTGNFLNDYYDDEGWWALTWIKAYDLTHQEKYLSMAKTIFGAMTQGWDDKCGGGLYWRTPHEAKNAIPNELFLTAAARLHRRTPGDKTYLDWAKREWAWFKQTGMITAKHQIIDGLNTSCVPGGPAYTYNQGVILGGLVELWRATGDDSLLDEAVKIADAALANMTSKDGVFIEAVCDKGNVCDANQADTADGCKCGGGDGLQFKGVFARNLAELYGVRPRPEYRAFFIKQSDSIWNHARNSKDELGKYWQGLFDGTADPSRQSSAMDALIGAVRVANMNLAIFRAASGSAGCNAVQGPDRAFDGMAGLDSKWCSGGLSGQKLQVDLGKSEYIVGFRVRHAGSGGEKSDWNTRDFSIETSADGNSWTPAVDVVGNTENVTTHNVPALTARYVRLVVHKAQTSEDFAAARIYELEVYGVGR